MAALSYSYLITKTVQSTGDNLSISTYGLWSVLSIIVGSTVFIKGGDYRTVVVYGIGAIATTAILIEKGKLITWSGLDTVVAILVIICLIMWKRSGEIPALKIAVFAGTLAALPYLGLCWKTPLDSPIIANIGFLIANGSGLIASKNWEPEHHLYFSANTALCFLLVLPWVIAKAL